MLSWTDWVPLEETFVNDLVPALTGLYRIGVDGDERLAYIGQTGRSLRERLRALRGAYAAQMPYRDPHTAAPALWAWLPRLQQPVSVSVCPVDLPDPQRKALEAVAIAEHRQRHSVSPRWNFGRMPPGFRMSSANNARLVAANQRFRGGQWDEVLPAHAPGIPPAGRLSEDVHAAGWCGHWWSTWQPLTSASNPATALTTGLYRIRGQTPGLVYVGEGNVRARLRAHAAKIAAGSRQGQIFSRASPLEFSVALSTEWLPHQRLELETDLIAAHTIAFGKPPAAQFLG